MGMMMGMGGGMGGGPMGGGMGMVNIWNLNFRGKERKGKNLLKF